MQLTLPEFVFLDGNSHEGDSLTGRTVLQHIRTYSIIEVFAAEEFKELHLNTETFEFTYKNKFGIAEKHIFALHFSLYETDDLPEIFEKCRAWYCNYLTWEDTGIIESEQANMN